MTPALLGTTLLRIALGAMLLAHGFWLKLFVFGLPGTEGFFRSLGFPAGTGTAVAMAETLAGLALVLGVQARWAALAVLPILLGATWAHAGNGWVFTAQGGGWEYPAYLSVLAMAQALLGDGAWALSRSRIPAGAALARGAA